MVQENIAITQPVVKYSFAIANLAVSQTATDIPIPGGVVNTYRLPRAGFIVGYSIAKSADHTAGSLDFDIELDGTSTLTIASDTVSAHKLLSEPNEPFTEGQSLGVTYTTDANLLATTVDVVVDVFVKFQDFDF